MKDDSETDIRFLPLPENLRYLSARNGQGIHAQAPMAAKIKFVLELAVRFY
jgi:hypothetical protein